MKIDLHMHSTASDGVMSPEELVDWALEKKMKAIAITDHEVLMGSRDAVEYSNSRALEVVSGVEIGADIEDFSDVHLVGLFVDLENEKLRKFLWSVRKKREDQKILMIERLNELGYTISFDEAKRESVRGSLARPHLARVLLKRYPEKFDNMDDVFKKLLGRNKPACIVRGKSGLKEVVDIIKAAGGVAILAHPGFYFERMEYVIEKFIESGGDGIEVEYNYNHSSKGFKEGSDELISRIRKMAKEKGLLISGGTDYHHDADCDIGSFGVSAKELEKLRALHLERV